MALQPVEPQRLYRQIAEQLRAGIAKGEFAVGARLPAERDLATQLGVSRPSVREALIALEVEGWVEIRTGSGIYVLDRSARTTPQSAPVQLAATEWGPLELIRARRLVEGEVAALAARLAKRKDIDAMVKAVQAMEADASKAVMPLDGDARFDGRAAGWVVMAPGSAHRPTVTGGRALVLYLLPQGAIQVTPVA